MFCSSWLRNLGSPSRLPNENSSDTASSTPRTSWLFEPDLGGSSMIFRTRDLRTTMTGPDLDVVLTKAEATFGRFPASIEEGTLIVGGRRFTFDPSRAPSFVLHPRCDRCDRQEVDQFAFALGLVDGAEVWQQDNSTCRHCRFIMLAGAPDASASTVDLIVSIRSHERRLERRARRRELRSSMFGYACTRPVGRSSGQES